MKFRIHRTSEYENSPDLPPHPLAVWEKNPQEAYIDRRTWPSAEAMPQSYQKEWFGRGTNHRVEDSGVVRDLPLAADELMIWTIEVADLAALMVLVREKHIVLSAGKDGKLPDIEIYDGWRE